MRPKAESAIDSEAMTFDSLNVAIVTRSDPAESAPLVIAAFMVRVSGIVNLVRVVNDK